MGYDMTEYKEALAEKIAQTPIKQRDASRLLVLNKDSGAWEHRHFFDLPDYLHKGDCLIVNDSRVLPARLLGNSHCGGYIGPKRRRPVPPVQSSPASAPPGGCCPLSAQ